MAGLTPPRTAARDAVSEQLGEIRGLLADLVERLDPGAPDLAAHEDARAVALQVRAWPAANAQELERADLRRLGDLCGDALTLEFSIGDFLLLSVRPGLSEAAFASFLKDAAGASELVVSLKVDKAALLSRLLAAGPAASGPGRTTPAPAATVPEPRSEA